MLRTDQDGGGRRDRRRPAREAERLVGRRRADLKSSMASYMSSSLGTFNRRLAELTVVTLAHRHQKQKRTSHKALTSERYAASVSANPRA